MTLLFRIVYAAHAKGTHHKLALDALRYLSGGGAEDWRRLFLKHSELYMQGAKAPDDEFKDFKNHVLHVRDGYWGGAPDKAVSWYGHLVTALKEQKWGEAVWAAGVLSHYYTDPIQPFHTGQSEAESNIHRAAEWSISKSYDALLTQGEAEHGGLAVTAANRADWLRDLVCQGADKANQNYEKLITHYDITRGVVDPLAGLDRFSRKVLSELIVYAVRGFAVVLDRAFMDAAVAPPKVDLTIDTVLAAIKIPVKQLAKKLADAEERRVVEAMYDELCATGRVDQTLPQDDLVIRDLHEKEVAAPRREALARERAAKVTAAAFGTRVEGRGGAVAPPPAPAAAAAAKSAGNAEPASASAADARYYLSERDDVERAPCIGPKMAERLEKIGIKTVAELLAATPDAVATGLSVRYATADAVALWQDQARLMVAVPGLRGTHAQLLTGAGLRTLDDLKSADAELVSARLLAFAGSAEGQAVLRSGRPPDVARIKSWLAAAGNDVAQAA